MSGGICPEGICPGVYVRGVFVLEPTGIRIAIKQRNGLKTHI